MTLRLAAIVTLTIAAGGCSHILDHAIEHGNAARMLPHFANCLDGDPVRLLIDRHCPGSVCGYSCLPDRWSGPNGRICDEPANR